MRAATVLAGAVTLAAAALRCWHLERVGISHWDAGSYTAGALGVGPYGSAPILPFYAPPLLPWLHELAFALLGVRDTVAIALAALVGAATVPLTYVLGRALVGETPALLGAAALAGMEYHVVYSRQPLTDGLYTLLFTASLLALWRGWHGAGWRAPLLAGLLTAAALLTKYHGFFPLVAFGALLVALAVPGLVRRTRDGRDAIGAAPHAAPAPPEPLPPAARAWRGLLLATAITGVAAAGLALDIHARIGFDVFAQNRSQWVGDRALYVLPQTARYVAACLASWVSPVALAAGALGVVVLAVRRRAGDVLLLAWLLLFAATLPLYRNYPRLVVPALPALALAAGCGLDACARVLTRRTAARVAAEGRTPTATPAELPLGAAGSLPLGAATALVAVVLVAGAWGARDALAVSDRGYAGAAAWLAGQGPTEHPDLLVTQHALLFYLRDAPNDFVCYDEAGAAEILASGRFRYLVADMRTLVAPPFRAAIESGALERVATVPNPLPEPFLVNLCGFDGSRALRAGAPPELVEELGTIRVYRRRGA